MAHQPVGGARGLGDSEPGIAARRDTIAARATAPGAAALAIVRVSGPAARDIATALAGREPRPRRAERCRLRADDGEPIDDAIVIYFPQPESFTGEEVVEFQVHGAPVVIDALLESVTRQGARLAEPGEFSLRAFLNDKLDLTQAEAIADLIASGSRASARAALRSLAGAFKTRVLALQKSLTELRVICEACLDFPEEEIDVATQRELRSRAQRLLTDMETLRAETKQGAVLTDGFDIVIAGPPNAGKSSLMNRLAGSDTAIVTDIPGTTRDVLQQRVVLDGLTFNLVDTAGVRESSDPIEREGVRRATAAIAKASHVLWVSDARAGLKEAVAAAEAVLPAGTACTIVLNKVDLAPGQSASREASMAISALTGEGIEDLLEHLRRLAGIQGKIEGTFSARRRHVDAIERAYAHMTDAVPLLTGALELAAEELRRTQAALGELTGEFTSDDLLGEIFSTFCIGK